MKWLYLKNTCVQNEVGPPILRAKIAAKLEKDDLIQSKSDAIMVTTGAKNSFYSFCLVFVSNGNKVVLIRPCAVSTRSGAIQDSMRIQCKMV